MTDYLGLYLQHCEFRALRPKTIKQYRLLLSRFIQWLPTPDPSLTTIKELRDFVMEEKSDRENSEKTLSTKVSILRAFYQWLYREEYIPKDPSVRLDSPRYRRPEPRFLTMDEIEDIRDVCLTLRDKLIFEFLYGSGVRSTELVNLNWDNINWNLKQVSIIDGKGGKDRKIPISTKTLRLLVKYKASRRDHESWIFMSREYNRMCKESVERRIRKLALDAGVIGRVTPHTLRHSLAIHLLEAGVPLHIISKILGHTSVSTTQYYARTQYGSVDHYYRKVIA